MAEKSRVQPERTEKSLSQISESVDVENNISCTATDILIAETPSETQLSSYSDYSCFITPSYHNPDALIFDKTLPGLTQGKRLTSTSATLSVHAHAHDRKPSKRLSPINEPSKYDPPTQELNNKLNQFVNKGGDTILVPVVPLDLLQKLYKHPPSSDYQNQNISDHLLQNSVPEKPVRKRSSESSNNNNRKKRSKSSVKSKASEGSQLNNHRNFRSLPPVQEDPENIPKPTAVYAVKSSSSSDSSDDKTKKQEHPPHHHHQNHPPNPPHPVAPAPPQPQPSNATTEKTKSKKKSCFSFGKSSSSSGDEKNHKGDENANAASKPVSGVPPPPASHEATADHTHHPPTKHPGHDHSHHAQHPKPPVNAPASTANSKPAQPPVKKPLHPVAHHPSEHPHVKFSPSAKSSTTPPHTVQTKTTAGYQPSTKSTIPVHYPSTVSTSQYPSTATSQHPSTATTLHHHPHPHTNHSTKPIAKDSDSSSESSSSEEESEKSPKSKRTSEGSSKGSSGNTGSTHKTGTSQGTKSTASHVTKSTASAAGAGGHGGGGGGKKDDDHHHHHHTTKKNSSSSSSPASTTSSEEEHSPHPPQTHSNHGSAHSVHSNVASNHPPASHKPPQQHPGSRPGSGSVRSQPTSRCSSNHELSRRPMSQTSILRTSSNHGRPQEGSTGGTARPQGPGHQYNSYSEDYHGNGSIPPVGSIRHGSPWPGIPIVDKNNEYNDKGINFDVSQQYVPPGGNPRGRQNKMSSSSGRHSCNSQGAVSAGRNSHGGASAGNNRGSYPVNKKHSSTLDVSINKKHQGSSTIYAGEGAANGEGSGYPEYPYYQGHHPQNGPHTFTPHGAGTPIRRQFSDHGSNVNIHVRKNGNDGYDDMGYNDQGNPSGYNDGYGNDYDGNGYGNGNGNGYGNGNGNGYGNGNGNGYGNGNGNNGNGYGNGNGNYGGCPCPCPTFIPMPIPFPMQCPCPCPCPPPPPPPPPCPPPCCCPKRKRKKKKKKKKSCDKQWDMMSMYGMYTLFQQMFSSWQNQMTEQYERSRPKPPPPQQYAVVMTNPCQAMAMMGGNGCNPPMVMMPGCGVGGAMSMSASGCSGGEPNPIFEVTGVEVRGDSKN